MIGNDEQPAFIVSTDLDGTLLDHDSYDWRAALPAIQRLQEQNIPIIFNTSKTLAEALRLQEKVGIDGPVIIENGSAIALDDVFLKKLSTPIAGEKIHKEHGRVLLRFGCDRSKILRFVEEQRQQYGNILEGYSHWSIAEISEKTGLSLEDTEISAKKYYSEPFIWLSDKKHFQLFQKAANAKGFHILKGGRFFHLQGDTNKASPLRWLLSAMTQKLPPKLICLGDNNNDIDMLNIADFPVCVRSPVAPYPKLNTNVDTIFTSAYGPEGWNEAILKILEHRTAQE